MRVSYIDIAKGFGIICVVFGHVLAYDLYGFDYAWDYSKLLQFIYAFHMPLFFFLSGLVSKSENSLKGLSNNVWKSVRRLLIPFLLIGCCYSLFYFDNGVEFIERPYKHGYWFLWVLFVYHILNYFICYIRQCMSKLGWRRFDVVIWAMVAAGWIMVGHIIDVLPDIVNNYLSLSLMVKFFPFFVCGNMIKQYNLFDLIFANTNVLITSLIFWILSTYISFPYSNLLSTFAQIVVIIYICRMIDMNNWLGKKSLLYIGQRTIFIYVFHFFFIQMMKTSFFFEFLHNYSNPLFDLILASVPTTVAVLGSLALSRLLDSEYKLQKFLFG